MKVYVVFGCTGEYSDHTQWNVAAYTEEEAANIHANLANDWLHCNTLHKSQEPGLIGTRGVPENPYDPDMQLDYTGTSYCVEVIDLFDHPDQFIEAQESKPSD